MTEELIHPTPDETDGKAAIAEASHIIEETKEQIRRNSLQLGDESFYLSPDYVTQENAAVELTQPKLHQQIEKFLNTPQGERLLPHEYQAMRVVMQESRSKVIEMFLQEAMTGSVDILHKSDEELSDPDDPDTRYFKRTEGPKGDVEVSFDRGGKSDGRVEVIFYQPPTESHGMPKIETVHIGRDGRFSLATSTFQQDLQKYQVETQIISRNHDRSNMTNEGYVRAKRIVNMALPTK